MPDAGAEMVKMQLRLYVVAGAPNSVAARANLSRILAAVPDDAYSLEVVDCIEQPRRALDDGVIVTPTLVRLAPEPVQVVVGSLSDAPGVVAALGIGTDDTTVPEGGDVGVR